MELIASAPGKLVLLGEYAVLEGAHALVLAVNRRAKVRIAARNDGLCVANAPDLGMLDARMSIDADGRLHWLCAEADAGKLRLVDHVWQGLLEEGLAPPTSAGFRLDLDTAGFFEAVGANRAKLGLGSSAALAVALASALTVFAGHGDAVADQPSWLRRLLRMHGNWQDGHGSGIDVAASLAGGLIAYRRSGQNAQPHLTPLDWPVVGVHCLFVWSGQAVSTVDFLRRLAQWRLEHQAEYAAHMRDLGALAEVATAALQQGRGADYVQMVARYATALRNFGAATGLEIFSPAHKRLADIVASAGASYKPCGAGGDFGVVVAEDADRLARIERRILDEGLHSKPLALDPQGFTCAIDLT
ncbi:phosphomevalonate kinase [mine drainage metagenome]|uniref:Phosphomevalonate kinase n=1 Tax=mine drainage metagenome TaxID=410659 RepID=T0ZUC0_9ZZZZ